MEEMKKRTLAIITDATQLPSYDLAKEFSLQGHELLLCGPHEEIFMLQDRLLDEGIGCEALLIEFNKHKSVEHLFTTIRDMDIPVSILLLNHFTLEDSIFSASSLTQDMQLMNQNVMTSIHMIKKILPIMYQNREGRIIIHFEKNDFIKSSLLNASYDFIHQFCKSLKEESQEFGVRIETLSRTTSWIARFKSQYLDRDRAVYKA